MASFNFWTSQMKSINLWRFYKDLQLSLNNLSTGEILVMLSTNMTFTEEQQDKQLLKECLLQFAVCHSSIQLYQNVTVPGRDTLLDAIFQVKCKKP